jgi:hypothetical protein
MDFVHATFSRKGEKEEGHQRAHARLRRDQSVAHARATQLIVITRECG